VGCLKKKKKEEEDTYIIGRFCCYCGSGRVGLL
jgi:hypothetical protein